MTGQTSLDIANETSAENPSGAEYIVVAENTATTDETHSDENLSMDHEKELLGTDLKTELGHEETSAGMPQFDSTTFANQFIWLAISLIAIYFILARIGLPRIGAVLEQRSNTIQRDLDQAAELKEKAAKAEETYQQALIDARAKAQGIAEDAKAKAQSKLDAEIAKADAEIDKQAKASAKRIADMQKDADKSVSEIAKDVTGAVIEAINPGANDGKLADKALAKLLKG